MMPDSACCINLSSVVLETYPDSSPWDLDPPLFAAVPDGYAPCNPFPQRLKDAALEQARRTGLNPFYFMCWTNPFVLDYPGPRGTPSPVLSCEKFSAHTTAPLPDISEAITRALDTSTIEPVANGVDSMYRICVDGETRILKLFLKPIAGNFEASFKKEAAAHARFSRFGTWNSSAVLQCHGVATLDIEPLKCVAMRPSVSSPACLRNLVVVYNSRTVHGLVFDDLGGAEVLSINNVTYPVADKALRALHEIHNAYVLQGAPTSRSILVGKGDSDEERVVWVDFSMSSCPENDANNVTRAGLLDELARGWSLLYARLIPDSLIGYEPDENSVDPWQLGRGFSASPLPPIRPRTPQSTPKDEVLARLFSYPEINLFSWDPPLHNLTPAPKDDDKFDSTEFLLAVKAAMSTNLSRRNPFLKWYGTCPLSILTPSFFAEGAKPFSSYQKPPPIAQLPTTPVTFLEHICPTGNRALFRVLIDGQQRLLKIFSSAVKQDNDDDKTSKERFDIELSAYSHLMHSGAGAIGVVPMCYGWMELSTQLARDANRFIRDTTLKQPVPQEPLDYYSTYRPPTMVSPIFDDEDFSPAAALVLEYLPKSEPLANGNITPRRADMALKALSFVHGAYVRHGDMLNSRNILVVHEDQGRPERVVFVDFDHAADPSWDDVPRISLLNEISSLWVLSYNYMLSQNRLFCNPICPPQTKNKALTTR
ncbi:hypothetical protein C8Q78DRAFT_1059137 [Trametes maxima]|nr:hypothetical protein C8Q78DRAFT_1059137 [Trametes maxima]